MLLDYQNKLWKRQTPALSEKLGQVGLGSNWSSNSFYNSAVVWTNDSLVFFDFRKMAFKVLRGDLAKRLLGVGVIWPNDSLVPGLNQHQGVFWPDHTPIVKVPNFIPGVWSGQKTPWCWGDLGKRLLGARAESAPRSLLSRSPQHQGVFCPDHPNTKESFGQIKNPKNSNFKSAFWA